MGVSVKNNLMAMNASRNLGVVSGKMAKNTEKLASGFKINRAADNAAGLAISEKLRRQVRGLTQATQNAQEGVSLCQVADGALAEVDSMLHRMTELSIQAANDTNTSVDRKFIQSEVQALKDEISRVGNTTTYNERYIFADIHGEPMRADKLVSSPAAVSGHLTESYQTQDGRYHSAATLDFSKVNEDNIKLLNGKSFTFTCSQSCDEAFKITFDYSIPYSQSTASNLSGSVEHRYTLGIKDLKSGSDIVNKLYEHVSTHMPNGYTPGTDGELLVSHSNLLSIVGGDKLAIYSQRNYGTKQEAEDYYKINNNTPYGAVNSSALTGISIVEDNRDLWIHTGTEKDTGLYVSIPRMNADVIGVGDVDTSTSNGAREAIDKIKEALAVISKARSDIGAQQNRLEHTINSNEATIENTAASESRIRDTDMAKEMVSFSINNILQQVGQSVMTQANQLPEGILTLLR